MSVISLTPDLLLFNSVKGNVEKKAMLTEPLVVYGKVQDYPPVSFVNTYLNQRHVTRVRFRNANQVRKLK